MPIIAVAAAKGGTGKTTAALSLAAALAELSADDVSTVLIDLDPCGDATQRMGVARESALLGALLSGRRNAADHNGLRSDRLAVSEWFPYESSVTRSAWSTGTPLFLAPASQCAESYRNLARNIQETIAQRKSLALLPLVRQHP